MIQDLLPVATVIPYAGPINPAPGQKGGSGAAFPSPQSLAYNFHLEERGWLVCDGRPIPIAKYPELFQAIGFIYGQKDTGHFLLPDYRGRFLRGVSGGAEWSNDGLTGDPDVAERKPSGNKGWSGDRPGSIQTDAFQMHKHDYKHAQAQTGPGGKVSNIVMAKLQKEPKPITGLPQDTVLNPPCQEKIPELNVRTKCETRPRNIYINLLIKFTSRPCAPFHTSLGNGLCWLDDLDLWLP